MERDDEPLARWQARLEGVALRDGHDDGSHDVAHARRVWRLAQRIADGMDEPVDRLVVLAGAYLHDAVAIEKNDPRRPQASRLAAEHARRVLAELAFPAGLLDAVAHAIEAHSWTAGVAPRTPEARVLQDADRIESLGAIGIARTFYVAGRMRSELFHSDDPLARDRPLDDRRYAVDHFGAKLLGLAATMTTAPGRRIAEERTEFIRRFVEQIASEA